MSRFHPLRRWIAPALLFPALVAADHAATDVDTVTVFGERRSVDYDAPPTEREPGGVARVGEERYEHRYARNLRDVLAGEPGVFASPRYAEEVRLSIRGSGLSHSFHLRGIDLLVDDIPINLADGAGDFQELDPLLAAHVDVYRGANAMTLNSATLGGAVRFTTPTAHTMPGRARLRFEVGGGDTVRLHGQTGAARGRADGWLGVTALYADGWRDHSRSATGRLSGNAGWRWSATQETRAWLTVNAIDADLPGALSREDALEHPRRTSQPNRDGRYARDIRSVRLALRHRVVHDAWQADVGGYVFRKRLFHPIAVLIDQEGDFYGVFAHLRRQYSIAGMAMESAVGAQWREGDNDARVYANEAGRRGMRFSDMRERADQASFLVEQRLWLLPRLQAIASAQWLEASRRFDDRASSASDHIRYRRTSPRLGLLYAPREDVQIFANVARSADPPILNELNQLRGATASFVPLSLQKARSVEAGSRGHAGRVAWDITLYRSLIDGELLAFSEEADTPAATFNADRTVHQGVEAAVQVRLAERLQAQAMWTFNDFRFAGDAANGDNRLAGIPRHLGRLSVRAQHGAWSVEPAWRLASKAEVDYANTERVPGYGVLDLGVAWERGGLLLFAELRNALDKRYLPNFSAVADAHDAQAERFYPGEARGLFLGVRHDY